MALLTNINGKFSVSDAGAVTFNNAFTFPTADGTANYVLKTNGSGQLAWAQDNDTDYDYWILQGDSASNVNINSTNTLKFVGGTYMDTSATWAGGANPRKLTINHETTSRTDTTSTDAPAFGGTFEAVTSVTTNTTGHITAIDVSTVTIPSDSGFVTGSGTLNTVPRWTATGSNLGDGPITFATNDSTFAGNVILNNNTGELQSKDAAGTAARILTMDNADTLILGNITTVDDIRFDVDTYGEGAMRIKSSGNVGIGTNSPDGKLQVTAASSTTSNGNDASFKLYLTNTDTTNNNYSLINFTDSDGGSSSGGMGLQYTDHTNDYGDLCFITRGSGGYGERMRIDSDGVLQLTSGINGYLNTNSIGMEMDINRNPETGTFKDTGLSHARIIMRGDTTANGGSNIKFVTSPTVNTVGTTKMTIAGNGNVGIGMTSPSRELDIQASSGWAEIALRGNTGGGGSLEFWTNTTKRAEIFADTEDIVFRNTATNAERMRITSGGNVGIGTTGPSAKLQVVNNSQSTSALTICNEANGGDGFVFQTWQYVESTPSFRLDLKQRVTSGVVQYAFDMVNNGTGYTSVLVLDRGNVGIGTTSPNAKLDVKNDDGVASGLHIIADFNRAAGADAQMLLGYFANGSTVDGPCVYAANGMPLILAPGTEKLRIQNSAQSLRIKGGSVTGSNYMQFVNSAGTSQGYFGYGGGSNILYITQQVAGDIAFYTNSAVRGSISTGGTLTMGGDIVAYGSPSDKRLKENIKPIESALDKVSKLQGVTFDWKDKEKKYDQYGKPQKLQEWKEDIGFIAQDVQKVIPELVRENEDGMLSMRHQGIAPILLEAIKELKAEIEELKLNNCNCNK